MRKQADESREECTRAGTRPLAPTCQIEVINLRLNCPDLLDELLFGRFLDNLRRLCHVLEAHIFIADFLG